MSEPLVEIVEFQKFPKIPRLSRPCVVTEKIDGTNAQICLTEAGQMFVGSRNRWLTQDTDNYGFCRWAVDHYDELKQLGPGRHYGEWWGQGINRAYGLTERRFSLFNTHRWLLTPPPACCSIVPVLWTGNFDELDVDGIMADLVRNGSTAVPGYHAPEGIVVYHSVSRTLFKKTFDNDPTGKGEE
jgi:hypothetical protein